jgi:hypothetical protein
VARYGGDVSAAVVAQDVLNAEAAASGLGCVRMHVLRPPSGIIANQHILTLHVSGEALVAQQGWAIWVRGVGVWCGCCCRDSYCRL